MQRLVRLFIFLLLSLALPINGMAQMLLPVGQGGMMSHESQAEASSLMHAGMGMQGDECFDHEQPGKGVVCKSGQECKTNSLLQLSLGKPLTLPLSQPVLIHRDDTAPALIPDAVWHPPRA